MTPRKKKNMQRYSYIKAIGLSLYSGGFYRDVARRWSGLGIIFLLLMILIFGGGTAILQTATFNQERMESGGFSGSSFQSLTNTMFFAIVEQFPEIVIKNGKASASVEQPFTIQNPYTRDALLIIDTTGQVTSLAGSTAMALITESGLITKSGKKDVVYAEFKDVEDAVLNKETLLPLLRWLPIITLPSNLIYMFIFFTISAFALGGIAQILNGVLKTGLAFPDTVRLAVVTTTPLLMLEAFQAVIGIQFFAYPMLVYFCMHAAYLYHALEANRPGARSAERRR